MTTGAEVAVAVNTFWLDVAKAGIGSFFGACFAIAVAMIVEHLKKRAENLVAGNNALTILSLQYGHFVFAPGILESALRQFGHSAVRSTCFLPTVFRSPKSRMQASETRDSLRSHPFLRAA